MYKGEYLSIPLSHSSKDPSNLLLNTSEFISSTKTNGQREKIKSRTLKKKFLKSCFSRGYNRNVVPWDYTITGREKLHWALVSAFCTGFLYFAARQMGSCKQATITARDTERAEVHPHERALTTHNECF
jgi:hypothetical protein